MAQRARAEGRETELLDALASRCDGAREDAGGTDPLFATFVAEWLEVRVESRDLTESEVESTQSIVRNHLVPFFGRLRLGQIDVRQIDRCVATKRRQKHQMLPPELMAALQEVASDELDALLFSGMRGGALANNSLNRWLRHARREAGVREVTSHGLRHTAGTSYAAMGFSQKAIAALLGHRDTKSTERCTHAADKLKAEAVDQRWRKVVQFEEARQRKLEGGEG